MPLTAIPNDTYTGGKASLYIYSTGKALSVHLENKNLFEHIPYDEAQSHQMEDGGTLHTRVLSSRGRNHTEDVELTFYFYEGKPTHDNANNQQPTANQQPTVSPTDHTTPTDDTATLVTKYYDQSLSI